MWMLIAFVVAGVFLFGLVQWAQTGASLWQIFRLRRRTRSGELSLDEHREAEHEVKRLERVADRTLGMSVRILGWLAVVVWALLGVSLVLESLGVDLVGELSSRAATYWTTTSGTGRQNATANRNNILRGLGNNLRN